MTTLTKWYESEEFTRDFLPWMYLTYRLGQPRLEVRTKTPPHLIASMLSFTAPCAFCRRPMHPFRKRPDGTHYCGVTCKDGVSGSCSKGNKAAHATASIAQVVKRYIESQGEQGGLL